MCSALCKIWKNIFPFHKKEEPSPEKKLGYQQLDDFLSCTLEDLMIPRSDIVAISSQVSFSEVVQTFLKKGFQWIPVYKETLDHVIGTISIHTVLALQKSEVQEKRWYKHVSPLFFAPSSMTAKEAIVQFHKTPRVSSIFVVDEYGGVEGMISSEHFFDALSISCVGDAVKDDDGETMIISEDPLLIISGRMDLDMFQEEFGMENFFSPENIERVNTIGGWLCSILGRVPLNGEVITHESGFVFEIRQADPRRIHQITILQKPTKAFVIPSEDIEI